VPRTPGIRVNARSVHKERCTSARVARERRSATECSAADWTWACAPAIAVTASGASPSRASGSRPCRRSRRAFAAPQLTCVPWTSDLRGISSSMAGPGHLVNRALLPLSGHAERRTFATLQAHARRWNTFRVEAPHRHDADASTDPGRQERSRPCPYEAPSRALSPGGSYGTSGRTSRRGRSRRPSQGSACGKPLAAAGEAGGASCGCDRCGRETWR
jgi:hypothetical protein